MKTYAYEEEDNYGEKKIPHKKKNKPSVTNGEGYFIEKSKKKKRRDNQYRDKERYDGKYDGWN